MARIDLTDSLSNARARVAAEAPVEERALAKFARLERKDTRIRADQDAALTALARTLMHRRVRKVERITENTLIRLAIDLLLAHSDQLRGSTEDELRKSVTAALRNSRTHEPPHSATADPPASGPTGLRLCGSVEAGESRAEVPDPAGPSTGCAPGAPVPLVTALALPDGARR